MTDVLSDTVNLNTVVVRKEQQSNNLNTEITVETHIDHCTKADQHYVATLGPVPKIEGGGGLTNIFKHLFNCNQLRLGPFSSSCSVQ